MAYCVFNSPLGALSLFEEDGALIALDWGAPPASSDQTSLLREACQQLAAYFSGELQQFNLPLAPQGTAFQKRLWQALSAIPYGQTRSYGVLAEELHSGPRAIGGACGANPIPIIIPCHRVLQKNKGLGGYSGLDGLETKQFLLRLEGVEI